MKKSLLRILICPGCKGKLSLKGADSSSNEVKSGNLVCSECDRKYEIRGGIPCLLSEPSQLPKQDFVEKHCEVRNANISYYDQAANIYEDDVDQSGHQNPFNQTRIDKIIQKLSQKAGNDYFLDLGCGTGNILKFGQKYYRRAVGVDISFNMLKIAQNKGLEVIQGDILTLPFVPNLFNTVSIFSVLHHLYNYQPTLQEIHRVLHKNGYLYTDWDPNHPPKTNKLFWDTYTLFNRSLNKLSQIKNRLKKNLAPQPKTEDEKETDFLAKRPDLRKVNRLAEYHNLYTRKERGIDFETVRTILSDLGFANIQAQFHQAGLSVNQLKGRAKLNTRLLKSLGYNAEKFLENILILARKREDTVDSQVTIKDKSYAEVLES